MEIIHVIRQYTPSIGGLEDSTRILCRNLSQMPGVTIRVVTLDRVFSDPTSAKLPAHEVIDGISVTRLSFFGSTRYPIAPDVLKAIKSADVIHVHAIDFFFDFLSIFRFLHRKPLVATTHGGFFHTTFAAKLKKLFFNTVTRFSCKGYKTICASSDNDATTFRSISPNNIITIENGVNIEKWHDAGSKTATRTLIFIGRWSTNKAVPGLIRLIAELRKSGNDWKLIIAGLPSDDTVESLSKLREELGVTNAVQIVASPSVDGIRHLIGSTSYIASASTYEGFGLSIIEGLSAGLYPVISPIPTFEEFMGALGFGVRFHADDLASTARELEKAHTALEADTAGYRKRCIDFSSRYSWDGVAQKFLDVYKAAAK